MAYTIYIYIYICIYFRQVLVVCSNIVLLTLFEDKSVRHICWYMFVSRTCRRGITMTLHKKISLQSFIYIIIYIKHYYLENFDLVPPAAIKPSIRMPGYNEALVTFEFLQFFKIHIHNLDTLSFHPYWIESH